MDKELFYVTSDLHFFHSKIIEYCNRPYEMNHKGITQMNEDIIAEFDKLPSGSTVINNGDLCINTSISFYELKAVIDRLKANDKRLWILLGNHDRDIIRYIKGQDFDSSYAFFVALGFDRVFEYPIVIDDIIFSHEPIYLNGLSNLKNAYGHLHDIDIVKEYFRYECDNLAATRRVVKDGNSKKTVFDIDTKKLSKDKKNVDVNNYFNVCWDKHYRLLKLIEVENTLRS